MSIEKIQKYEELLKAMAMLSRLSSESLIPYLGYREVENIFCLTFDAVNLSRSDCSADAMKDGIGYGIKTFLEGNGQTLQKIAEFNADAESFRNKTTKEIVEMVSQLRNNRIEFTKRTYGINKMRYHCVVRSEGKIKVFECDMDAIELESLKDIRFNGKNIITFKDNKNEYSFNISKSTLYKRFITSNVILEFGVEILEDPYSIISKVMNDITDVTFMTKSREFIYLPLYSEKGGINVPERSGLNQWNARGRARDYDEVYIPIPSWINSKFTNFFPGRDKPFNLNLPDGKVLSAKVCQDNNKALMSNPNKELGKWILRQVLNLSKGEILTYSMLEDLGIDSVVIYKNEDDSYEIDFAPTGSFEKFKNNL